MIQLCLEILCKKKKKKSSCYSEEFNHDYLSLVRQCENLPNPPLLGYPKVWEGGEVNAK